MRSLSLENEIELWTVNGPSRIQLLSGDITTLSIEEKVDIIMVSAFPGDYAPVASTVIGALKNNLGISVRELSYNKQLDLRFHFSCWLSTINTKNSPFKKLLCFERKYTVSMMEQVSQMFRVFVPVFNNQDNSVITPLLTAGNQGGSELAICETMVKAGAYWINAGLSLRCLKIVIFRECNKEISDMFQKLKKKLLAKNWKLKNRITKKAYDIFLSFHPKDESKYVSQIVGNFKKKQSEIKVCATVMKYNHDAVWQSDIFKAMVSSKRIIVVLTTLFMESGECLEQYNMAMCCNKLMGGNILVPFYLETINSMPAYMSLVQWVDCRERKEGDTTLMKIQDACTKVVGMLEQSTDTYNTDKAEGSVVDKFQYDVFISYSHKNPQEAERLLNVFKEVDDSVGVFYDRNALTSGINWQEMLYKCMGQCKCAIALLSPSYLTSTVCMEEYNLALARFLSQDKGMQFLPVWIEKSDVVPIQVSGVAILDAVGRFDEKAHDIARYISGWLKNSGQTTDTSLFPSVSPKYRQDTDTAKEDLIMEKVLSQQRSSTVTQQYTFKISDRRKQVIERVKPLVIANTEQISGSDVTDVVISTSNSSSYIANIFCIMLDERYPHLKINVTMEQSMERMEALHSGRVLVIFLCTEYLQTDSHMHELYLALARQRSSNTKILYLIKTSSLEDCGVFFPRILTYDLATIDSVWGELEREYLKKKYHEDERRMVIKSKRTIPGQPNFLTCKPAEYFTMTKAADDVIELVLNLRYAINPLPNDNEILLVVAEDLINHCGKRRNCSRDKTIPYTPMLLNLVAVEMEVTGTKNNSKLNQDSEMTGSSHTAVVPGVTEPTNDTVPQGPPTDTVPQGPPTDTVPQGPPTDTVPQGPPTDTAPQGPPTDTVPQGPPTDTVPQGPPTDTVPQGPHTDTEQNVTDHTASTDTGVKTHIIDKSHTKNHGKISDDETKPLKTEDNVNKPLVSDTSVKTGVDGRKAIKQAGTEGKTIHNQSKKDSSRSCHLL